MGQQGLQFRVISKHPQIDIMLEPQCGSGNVHIEFLGIQADTNGPRETVPFGLQD